MTAASLCAAITILVVVPVTPDIVSSKRHPCSPAGLEPIFDGVIALEFSTATTVA